MVITCDECTGVELRNGSGSAGKSIVCILSFPKMRHLFPVLISCLCVRIEEGEWVTACTCNSVSEWFLLVVSFLSVPSWTTDPYKEFKVTIFNVIASLMVSFMKIFPWIGNVYCQAWLLSSHGQISQLVQFGGFGHLYESQIWPFINWIYFDPLTASGKKWKDTKNTRFFFHRVTKYWYNYQLPRPLSKWRVDVSFSYFSQPRFVLTSLCYHFCSWRARA